MQAARSCRLTWQPAPAGRPTRARRFAAAFSLWGIALFAPVPAAAQITVQEFGPIAGDELVSVGDPLTVRAAAQLGGLLPQLDLTYTYLVSPRATYIPNSVTIGGAPASDADNRVEVGDGFVRVSLGTAGPGSFSVSLRLRAVGNIGEAIEHTATVEALFAVEQVMRGQATRIEDDRASLLSSGASADSRISAAQPTWNYGGAGQLVLSNQIAAEQRGVLRFDLSDIALTKNQIAAARLELWPTYQNAAPATLSAYRLRRDWTEGAQAGAVCTNGVTWRAPNCSDSWVAGGDHEGAIEGSTIVTAQSTYAAADILALVRSWVGGTTTNQGLEVITSGIPSGSTLTFASKEGASQAAPAARLSIVAAPDGAYEEHAVKSASAEIVPSQVASAVVAQRFVYSVLPTVDPSDTGMNRLHVDVPAEFTSVAVDSVLAHGLWLQPNGDAVLSDTEFEVWPSDLGFDVRVAPTISRGSLSRLMQVVFRATTPVVVSPKQFALSATVDHDRRGYAAQAARSGEANGLQGDSDTWVVTVVPPTVVGLIVTPADTSVAQGLAVPYRAWAEFTAGSREEVTSQVLWSVAPLELGSFAADGTFTATQQGAGAVSAVLGTTVSLPASLRVDPPRLKALSVEPAHAQVPVGEVQGFVARGIYTSGDTLAVTDIATWAAYDTTVAMVLAPGMIQGVRAGVTGVTATLDAVVSAPATLDVSPAELLSLVVMPADTTVALGRAAPLRAFGTYTDGNVAELTSVVAWTSTPPGIVDVGADGVVTSLGEGTAAVTASLDAVDSAPASFTVSAPVLAALDGSPDAAVVPAGVVHHVETKGIYSDGSTQDLTLQVAWQSLDPSVATFLGPGRVFALAPGTARLSHGLAGIQGDTLMLQVTAALLDSVTVAPAAAQLPPGVTLPLSAAAHFSDGSTIDVTGASQWVSDSPAVAEVDTNGVARTLTDGVARITADFGGQLSVPSVLQVTAAALQALAIAPADTTVPLGLTTQYAAWGWANGTAYDLSASVAWSSADSSVAAIGPLGLVRTRGQGNTTIVASLGDVQAAPATLAVSAPAVLGVDVVPAVASLLLWRTKAFQATARMSDGQSLDVTALSLWETDVPSVVYVQPDGVAVALSLGTAQVRARWQSVLSNAAALTVLPSVRVEPLAAGEIAANPGSPDRLLLSLRLDNAYLQPRDLSALRVTLRDNLAVVPPAGPLPDPLPAGPRDDAFTALRLRRDDGDGVFEPTHDVILATGVPTGGNWTASSLALQLPVGGSQTLFVSGDVSLENVAHLDSLDVAVAASTHLFWGGPTAVVAPAGFPLDSVGQVLVEDMVLAQIAFTPVASDTVHPGQAEVPLLSMNCPDNGRRADVLDELRVRQIGTARAGIELEALRLQQMAASGWESVVDAGGAPVRLVHTGGPAWVASGLDLAVPAGGVLLRVVADVSAAAEQSRTLQLQLPTLAMAFGSGRAGPVEAGWTNPGSMVVDIIPTLYVRAYAVQAPPPSVPRHSRRLPVLGVELQAQAAAPDTLIGLRLLHASFGPTGLASDPDAQIETAELWLDRDGDGAVDALGLPSDDQLLEQLSGFTGGVAWFGQGTAWAQVLSPAQPVRLLVTLTPDSSRVRDAERLAVQLAAPTELQVLGPVAIDLPTPLSTQDPPVIDGQGAAGYAVRPVDSQLVYAGSQGWPVLDLALPANGLEDDTLEALRIENSGTATKSDIAAMVLRRDDGDGVAETADLQVAVLAPIAARTWEATGLGELLPAGPPARYWVTVDLAQDPQSGATISARLPRDGVTMASGNDGPYDLAADGGGPAVVAVADRITWVAGVAGSHAVPPDALARSVLVLEGFNGYLQARTLTSLQVQVGGTAAATEYGAWGLHHDANRNGVLDRAESDVPLAIAADNAGSVRFEGFTHDLPPLQQDRLFVSYSLAFGTARDGSTIDAVVPSASSFGYADDGGTPTTSVGDFNLDSPGVDTVDGMILAQVPGAGLASRTLGAGESNVLALNRRLPSNGWESDTLQQLTVELFDFGPGQTALMGDDIEALRLWIETDAGETFDPGQDLLVATVLGGQSPLRFDGLSVAIPVGGRRFYITADVGPSPGDGHKLRLRVPLGGIQMISGNDGPIDLEVLGAATHRISASNLLVAVDAAPNVVSRGQTMVVRVAVRNQGSQQLDGVVPLLMQATPSAGAVLLTGPTPADLDLAAGQADTLTYQYALQALGEVQFSTQVSSADTSVVSDLATSAPVRVQSAPTALLLQPLSSLPVSVNRGQTNIVPLAWQLSHADPDTSEAAGISVETLTVAFDDGAGVPLPASSVIAHLAIRTGSLVHAEWTSIPAQSSLSIDLDPPILLVPGQARSLPLEISIAPAATASRFRLALGGAAAVAVDVNSGASVALQAPSPWHTSAAYIRTLAARVDVAFAGTLPAAANQGQSNVPAGRLTFTLPGAAGESEARVVELALAVRDTADTPLDPAQVLSALRIRSGGTVLASVVTFDAPQGLLRVPLSIPRPLTSGAPETLDLEVDLLAQPAVDRFQVAIPDSSCLVVQDANTGIGVPAFLATGQGFPLLQGPLWIQLAPERASVAAASICPAAVAAGATAIPLATVTVSHDDPAGHGDLELWALSVRVLDETGSPVAPGRALTALAVSLGATPLVRDDAPPTSGSSVDLILPQPVRLSPGGLLQLELSGDLESPAPAPRLRFALDVGAISLRDANQPARAVSPTGLPFASELMRVVAPATAVAVGVTADPPVNLLRGATAAAVLPLRLLHPGGAAEAPLEPRRLVLLWRDRDGATLPIAAVATAVRLRMDQTLVAATVAVDSASFDLSSLPDLAQGAQFDLILELDVAPEPAAEDFRVRLEGSGLLALAGNDPLPVTALPQAQLPYLSPSVHLMQPTLRDAFSSYPSPFAAGRDRARVAFFLAAEARVTLDVYSITGERVRRLLDGELLPAGLQDDERWAWDGRNGAGETVRNGAYLLRLEVDGPQGGELLRKLAVLR